MTTKTSFHSARPLHNPGKACVFYIASMHDQDMCKPAPLLFQLGCDQGKKCKQYGSITPHGQATHLMLASIEDLY